MVSKITLFEIHLDDARFGTNETVEGGEAAAEEATESGPSVAKLVLASLFLSVAVTVVVRRLFGEESTETTAEEPIDVEIEP